MDPCSQTSQAVGTMKANHWDAVHDENHNPSGDSGMGGGWACGNLSFVHCLESYILSHKPPLQEPSMLVITCLTYPVTALAAFL